MSRAKKEVTIADLAALCGVSTATVSRALSGNGAGVSAKTYNSILSAAASSGYSFRTPLPAAPSNIIIACVDPSEPDYYNLISKGISAVAASYHYSLLFWQFFNDREFSAEELLKIYSEIRPAGIILAIPTIPALLARISKHYPVVQCGEYSIESIPHVVVDEYQAVVSAIRYLLSSGHRKIAYIQKARNLRSSKVRLNALWDTLADNGVTFDPRYLVSLNSDSSNDLVVSSIEQLFRSDDHPDAVFAASDYLAAAAIRVITDLGLRVPEDVSVISYGNTSLCKLVSPSISSLTYPLELMGQLACELLFDQILYKRMPPSPRILNSELIVRSSSL